MDRNKLTLTIEEKIKLKFLIAVGTPATFRSKVTIVLLMYIVIQLWFICSGAKKEQYDNQDYYNQMIKMSEEVPSLYSKQIIKDIARTQKGKSNDSKFYQKLKRILICYSIRNSSIGYCQGFNFICSRLLQIIGDEEDTFWIFVELIEEILPINYYSELAGIIVDTTVITSCLKKYFPELHHFFEVNDNMTNTFIHKSLLALFTQDYDEETSLLIWDLMFLEGNIVLIKTCLAVFGCLSKRLATIDDDDIESLFSVFSSEVKLIKCDSSILLHSLAIKQFEFNEEFLEKKRCYLANRVIDNIEKQNLEKVQEKMKAIKIDLDEQTRKSNECKVEWPYCLNDSYFETMNEVVPFIVIHTQKYPIVYYEYFFETINELDSYMSMKLQIEDDLLINRRPHYCSLVINENKFERSSIENRKDYRKNSSKTSISQLSSNTEECIEDDYRTLYEKLKASSTLKWKSEEDIMDGFDPEPFIDYHDTPEKEPDNIEPNNELDDN